MQVSISIIHICNTVLLSLGNSKGKTFIIPTNYFKTKLSLFL